MIPLAFIQQWTASAPWADLRQVQRDLIISRALCDLFTSPALRDRIAFRGGTREHQSRHGLFSHGLAFWIQSVRTRCARSLPWLGNISTIFRITPSNSRSPYTFLGRCGCVPRF